MVFTCSVAIRCCVAPRSGQCAYLAGALPVQSPLGRSAGSTTCSLSSACSSQCGMVATIAQWMPLADPSVSSCSPCSWPLCRILRRAHCLQHIHHGLVWYVLKTTHSQALSPVLQLTVTVSDEPGSALFALLQSVTVMCIATATILKHLCMMFPLHPEKMQL